MRSWLGLLLAATGCFGLSLGDEPFVCGGEAGDLCPPGYECIFGVCSRQGRPDAAPPDGAIDASCAPSAFQSCEDGTHALVCNGDGTGILLVSCPGGCNQAEQLCVRCQPNTVACEGDELQTCGPDGDVIASKTCHAGCSAASCLHLVPSNLPANVCTLSDSTDMEIDARTELDTAGCAANGGTRILQPGGGEVCMLIIRRLRVMDTGTLRVIGDVPLALVATEDIEIDGRIEVGGEHAVPGPGGNDPAGVGGSGSTTSNPGGGGGGFLTAGGNGFTGGNGAGVAPLGGAAFGVEELVPLSGGGGGGDGGQPCGTAQCTEPVPPTGGGAGGGLHLVACQDLELGPTARVSAGGGGGIGGRGGSLITVKARADLAVPPAGGGGGGSGGAILIEAPVIVVPNGAKITATGGGGASGGLISGSKGADGRDAHDEVPGLGGMAPGGAGPGGRGGIGDGPGQLPEDGKKGADVGAGGGGAGGGAAGRIRLNARPDRPIVVAPGARVVPVGSRGVIEQGN